MTSAATMPAMMHSAYARIGTESQMPHALRWAGNVRQNGCRHAEILCLTPSASSSVSARTAAMPSSSADTSAEPTMTPSA